MKKYEKGIDKIKRLSIIVGVQGMYGIHTLQEVHYEHSERGKRRGYLNRTGCI